MFKRLTSLLRFAGVSGCLATDCRNPNGPGLPSEELWIADSVTVTAIW